MNFTKDNIQTYNLFRKQVIGISTILGIIATIGIILGYYFVLRNSDFILIQVFNTFVTNITFHIKNATALGALYSAFFGGLFFIFLPLEAIFVTFLKGNNPILMIALYNLGFIFSFTANYYIGMRFSELSKKIISLRKFYKTKGLINKYGGLAVFTFNVLPLPAQSLSAILGVFKYNKTRFYLYFLSGQIIKYTVITIGYFYIT